MENNDSQQLMTTTSSVSLEIYRPDVLGRELRCVRNVGDALAVATDRNKYPSLARLRKDLGEEKIEAVIKLHLIDLCRKVNAKRSLSPEQIDEIAFEIVNSFYHFTIADIHVVFRRAKMGEYGEFYDLIDMPKVLGWFRSYNDERIEAAAQESINQSGSWNVNDNRRDSERWQQHFNKIGKKMKK